MGIALLWSMWASGPRRLPSFHVPGRADAKRRASFRVDGVGVAGRRPMPAISFERLDSGTWNMGDESGKVVAINFWATWCEPCVSEIPFLVKLAERDRASGLVVVGVAMDGGGTEAARTKVRQFAEGIKMTYPVVLPPPRSQMEAGLEGLPTTILVDRAGRVAQTYVGALDQVAFERDVQALLTEKDARSGR